MSIKFQAKVIISFQLHVCPKSLDWLIFLGAYFSKEYIIYQIRL